MSNPTPKPSNTLQQHNNKHWWGNLHGSALALQCARLAEECDRPLVVVTDSGAQAYQLEQEIRFFLGRAPVPVLDFPDWETLPYDSFSPHQDIISQRLSTLHQLPQLTKGIVIVPVSTAMHRISPVDHVRSQSLILTVGQKFSIDEQRRQLEQTGYHCVDTVYEHGEFAIRGAIVDIFPMGASNPLRIDLFDDEIETLRTFDPDNQRSLEKLDNINLLPAKEFPLTPEAITTFKDRFRERFDVDQRLCPLYKDVSEGIASSGIEYFLPLFFDQCASLFDYLPANALLISTSGSNDQAEHFRAEVLRRYEDHNIDLTRPLLRPDEIFLSVDELFNHYNRFDRILTQPHRLKDKTGRRNWRTQLPQEFPINNKAENPLSALEAYLTEKTANNYRILFCAESAGRRESLLELLTRIGVNPAPCEDWHQFCDDKTQLLGIAVAPLDRGLVSDDDKLILITESQLFGQRIMQRRRRKKEQESNADAIIKNLTELSLGSPVVHIDAGIGRYRGLITISVDSQDQEFLMLEYANQAKLYVPVSNLHLISRYSGSEDERAPLHKLGSDQWQKQKRKAAEKIHDVAAELLNIYARRAAKKGHSFSFSLNDYEIFSAGFPFEETPDQINAIDACIIDMKSDKPMDRLVCGDVGFGKTEVAMRAAFVAVQGGAQVAILAPTTLLAQQHYESFKDRFADWPVQVEVLSRFKSNKEQGQTLQKMVDGKVDITIGTHKLLQKDIKFKNLGLIIVDEEHRFGVTHKEKLKTLRTNVDLLTLTATPIPRTLNMAMNGIRDLSIIATPPAKRLSIKTFVRESTNALIKEAVLRELLRGGQVYFLHNEVKSIEKTAREIEKLIPEARVAIGHGQMPERELEQVMADFYHKRFNVLVCTTIIETGIDVPSANTIVMDRADKLGLAQLHQLRGRVGRSHHQAYAYLLTPNPKVMTSDARKRLEAIEEATTLGAGFTLASHDMEIRGTGELLGDEQSGHISSVGFSLYMEMLEQAVQSIKNGESPNWDQPLKTGTEINLRIPALIPEDYLPDVHNRLMLYKRISSAKDERGLKELQIEMIDRFGLLPEQVKYLFRTAELRQQAEALGIGRLDAGANSGKLEFSPNTKVEALTIVKMVQRFPDRFKLEGADKLRFNLPMETHEQRIEAVHELLNQLAGS